MGSVTKFLVFLLNFLIFFFNFSDVKTESWGKWANYISVLKFMTISLEEEQHGEDEMQDVDANVNTLDEEVQSTHRRRMATEAKAKVVVSVWGVEFIQSLAAQAILPGSI